MPYNSKTLIVTGEGLASSEKRLSICLGANGFSFSETTCDGRLLTFGDVEGTPSGTMTGIMADIKAYFGGVGINPLGYSSMSLVVETEANVWVPDELYEAGNNRLYLTRVGGTIDDGPINRQAVYAYHSDALSSVAIFAATDALVTAFKVAVPGLVVMNQHAKMASCSAVKRSVSHPVLMAYRRESGIDFAAFVDGRYLKGGTVSVAADGKDIFQIVELGRLIFGSADNIEMMLCGNVEREHYAALRPYFPKITLWGGDALIPTTPQFHQLRTYRYTMVLC